MRTTHIKNNKIINGFFEKKAITDYTGIYSGLHLEFDAKSTNQKRFYLRLLAAHQLEHLLYVKKHGGYAFILLYFRPFEKAFLLDIYEIYDYIKKGEKSIPFETLLEKNDIIKIRKYQENYYLDYLDVLKRMECYGTKKEKKTNKKKLKTKR